MATDKTHLRQRGNIWWLHYRIPERHKLLPECVPYKEIVTKSLKTDSLREARRRRDVFLRKLDFQEGDHYKAWIPERIEHTPDSSRLSLNWLKDTQPRENPNIETIRGILARGSTILGNDPSSDKLASVARRERDAAFALVGDKRHSGRNLNALTKMVVREKQASDLADKTINKIERGTSWFLEYLMQKDIDIDQIDYDIVSDAVMDTIAQGKAGSTIKGYLYGLNQIWLRAKRSKIVTGESPFRNHSYSTESVPYDTFTHEEMQQLYDRADPFLKNLIHACATTGARIGELLRAEIKDILGYRCWVFNFKNKGKNEQSTRIVPLHDSLKLETGFTFNLSYTPARNRINALISEVLGTRFNELTGKKRHLTFHSFRHTLITELVIERGLNEKLVGSVTGHRGGGKSKAGAIKTYIHVEDLRKKKAVVDLIPWDFGVS